MPTGARAFGYPVGWLSADLVAGITLAAYAIPVSLAYATLAGLPPQVGVYGYLLGGLGYALAGSSRFLAVGPTSAISLMIAGAVGNMAGDDMVRYAQIASAAAFGVGLACLIAWLFRLSVLVKLISDSVLTGFKAGAGLTIALTQLPALFGVNGGGHGVPERLLIVAGQLGGTNLATLAVGLVALALLWCGERWLPGRPVALGVVALSIIAVALFGLTRFNVTVTGVIPPGLPLPVMPTGQLRDQEGIGALAIGCMLLAYIEGVAAARAFATKHRHMRGRRQRQQQQDRDQRREQDALQDAKQQHPHKSGQCVEKIHPAGPPHVSQRADIHEPAHRHHDHSGEHRLGQAGEQRGEEHQAQRKGQRGEHQRHAGTRACPFVHRGLRQASRHRIAAECRGCDVGSGQTQ